MISKLIKLANQLDSKGMGKEADYIDRMIFSYAQMQEDEGLEENDMPLLEDEELGGASKSVEGQIFVIRKGNFNGQTRLDFNLKVDGKGFVAPRVMITTNMDDEKKELERLKELRRKARSQQEYDRISKQIQQITSEGQAEINLTRAIDTLKTGTHEMSSVRKIELYYGPTADVAKLLYNVFRERITPPKDFEYPTEEEFVSSKIKIVLDRAYN